MTATPTMRELALAARAAGVRIAALSSADKRNALTAMAAALDAQATAILAANQLDVDAARAAGKTEALVDRLRLDAGRLKTVAAGVRAVGDLPDPVGAITRSEVRPNGLVVERVRIPLGLIAMIYESRPNVTADAAALCFMAGNVALLRGGSEAIHSNRAIAEALRGALRGCELPEAAITLVEDLRREAVLELLQLSDLVDLAIPRGGQELIRFVADTHACRSSATTRASVICMSMRRRIPILRWRCWSMARPRDRPCAIRWKRCSSTPTSRRTSCHVPPHAFANAASRYAAANEAARGSTA